MNIFENFNLLMDIIKLKFNQAIKLVATIYYSLYTEFYQLTAQIYD